ncbi:hypothetical protein, partial [Streptomyces sp. ADI93-02]|uniref:hypothetical protein n=1 Tax=Streptomyces sp. ADI93-02 TaxID=1522757 RepID=UPI0019D27EFF
PVPPSLGTKPRIYCGRNCRQRAYEAKRTRSIVNVAVEVALGRQAKSRDNTTKSRDSSEQSHVTEPGTTRDFAESPQVSVPEPAPPSDAPVAKQLYWGLGPNGMPMVMRDE